MGKGKGGVGEGREMGRRGPKESRNSEQCRDSWDCSCGDHVEVLTPQLLCSRLLLRAAVV